MKCDLTLKDHVIFLQILTIFSFRCISFPHNPLYPLQWLHKKRFKTDVNPSIAFMVTHLTSFQITFIQLSILSSSLFSPRESIQHKSSQKTYADKTRITVKPLLIKQK